MPNQNKPPQDLRIKAQLQKKLNGALDILENSVPPLIDQYNSLPENLRAPVLEHSPILARIIKLKDLINNGY